jgi:hypothetical protein
MPFAIINKQTNKVIDKYKTYKGAERYISRESNVWFHNVMSNHEVPVREIDDPFFHLTIVETPY